MNTPVFINTDSAVIIAEIVADYEAASGKTLQPGQAEFLLINAFAFREKILREQIQAAGLQMLISFSTAPALDYLAELVGLTRLSASSATTTIQFTLTAGHSGIVIPANTRIASTDGQVYFSTQENITVAIGINTISATCFASVTGDKGNGYAIGTINKILDPWPFVELASNTTSSSGGADAETDDSLRERAKLAPSQFSVAGPTDAYKFFAKSASPDIIDVAVLSSVPGTVEVYPLVSGGIVTPQGTLDLVATALNDKKVRPLSDTVNIISPTLTAYNIDIEVVTYTDADVTEVTSTIQAALEAYTEAKQKTMGADIRLDQITAVSVYDITKVFDVNIISPSADVVIPETGIGTIGTITITITGSSDG